MEKLIITCLLIKEYYILIILTFEKSQITLMIIPNLIHP